MDKEVKRDRLKQTKIEKDRESQKNRERETGGGENIILFCGAPPDGKWVAGGGGKMYPPPHPLPYMYNLSRPSNIFTVYAIHFN